jgi:hypothetical protein
MMGATPVGYGPEGPLTFIHGFLSPPRSSHTPSALHVAGLPRFGPHGSRPVDIDMEDVSTGAIDGELGSSNSGEQHLLLCTSFS